MGSIEEMYRQAEHQSQAGPQRIEQILAADYAKTMGVINEVAKAIISSAKSRQSAKYRWVVIGAEKLICWEVYEWIESDYGSKYISLDSNGNFIFHSFAPYSDTLRDQTWRYFSLEIIAGDHKQYPYTHVVGLYPTIYGFTISGFRSSIIEVALKEFGVSAQSHWFDSRYEELRFYNKIFGPSESRLTEINSIATVNYYRTFDRINQIIAVILSRANIKTSPKCQPINIHNTTYYKIDIMSIETISEYRLDHISLLSDGRLVYSDNILWNFLDQEPQRQYVGYHDAMIHKSDRARGILLGLLRLAKQEFNIGIGREWFDSELDQLIFEKQTKK